MKKVEITTSLSLTSPATAQAICEAHIQALGMMLTCSHCNVLHWSSGLARKVATQVEIMHTYDIVMVTKETRRVVVAILQSVVETWPTVE